jgi:hypothetical protein
MRHQKGPHTTKNNDHYVAIECTWLIPFNALISKANISPINPFTGIFIFPQRIDGNFSYFSPGFRFRQRGKINEIRMNFD